MKVSVAFRVDEKDKDFLYGVFGEYGMSITEFMEVLLNDLKTGKVIFTGESFSIANKEGLESHTEKSSEHNFPKTDDNINLGELYKLADRHRITAQSLLDSALRPFRV